MTEEDAENGDFDGFGSFFDAHFKNEFMNFNFMDDEDDMMDFMEHLSNEQFKDMFKGLGKNYRGAGPRQMPKGRAAHSRAKK